jgi:4-amino-4-deoxy-L-arabinose transferase-like glycosyltransferase
VARPRLSWAVLGCLVLLVAIGGWLRFSAGQTLHHHLSPDERAYGRLAIGIADHGTYGDRAMTDRTHWAPGAPVAFALATRLIAFKRPHQLYEVPAARMVQAVAGTLTIVAAAGLAALLGGLFAGLAAALGIALYPALISIDHFQLSEPLAALLVALGVLALALAGRTHAARWTAASGVLFGLAVLTRADLLLAPFAAALALWWIERERDGRRRAALLAGGVLVVVLPWCLFASVHRGHLVPVSDAGPSTLFMGTYLPGRGTVVGFKRGLAPEARRRIPALRGEAAIHMPAGAILDAVAARDPGQSRNGALTTESLRNVRRYLLGDPLAYAGMTARKVARMWWRPFHSPHAELIAVHLLLLAIGVAGLALGVRRRHPVYVAFAAFVLWSTINNAILVAEPRHNMPLMPALVALGVAGLATRARPA